MEVQINWVAVVLAGLSTMVVGTIWYARGVFGNTWSKLAKVDMKKAQEGGMVKPILVTLVASLVTAYVLAHVTYLSNHFFGNSFMNAALMTAFWVWLGFTAARFVTHDAFEGRPASLTVINIAHELVTFMVMGAIIGFFKP